MEMRATFLFMCFFIEYGFCNLWPKGVVHFTINKKDYDIHSQDEILSTFARIEKEICVKFFNTPDNFTANEGEKILYITNPEKKKTCPPEQYDYSKSVVDMPIGYKCINPQDISRIVVDMLRASITQSPTVVNSYDLAKKFKDLETDTSSTFILTPADRNYINGNYYTECGTLGLRTNARRVYDEQGAMLSSQNHLFYKDKIWPLAIVMYSVDKKLRGTPDHSLLKQAITSIELRSCIVFQEDVGDEVLQPKNLLWFGTEGADEPQLGFREGNQTIKLESMVHGTPGHVAHAVNNLFRALGVPMISNRFDREHHVTVVWKNVKKGKEHLLERLPELAWLQNIPYDFDSVTHAPANYMSDAPELAAYTVKPLQDYLWQRTVSMGHRAELSEADALTLHTLYAAECDGRYFIKPKTK